VPLIAADLPAVCLLTSGSTGAPQPHAKSFGALVVNIAAEATRLAELLQRPSLSGLNLVATVPAQHSYGFESTVLLALLGGAAFDSGRPFYAADIAAALARVPAPRALVTTPFHLKTLLAAGVVLPDTALTLCATAALSPQLAARAEAAMNGMLVEIYGCTEAGQVATRRTTQGEMWHTLGALRVTGSGEGFSVQGGHVVQPTPLADVLALHDAQHFRLLGRANDVVHVAGKRSSLAHLNFHLNRIAGVEDGTFWLPDDVAEAVVRPVVFVVAPTLSAQHIIAALREHIESAFVPRRVVHVAALPREATGKLTAHNLRRFALQTLHGVFEIGAEHPAFAGHFPGQPVLPGVVLLSLVMQALQQQPALQARLGATPCIDQVKFLRPVGPGARLRVVLGEQGTGVAFEVQHGEHIAARGQLSAAR
jgi:acyl-coenzyme A synthetase/AMP-(fatty) acid ligase